MLARPIYSEISKMIAERIRYLPSAIYKEVALSLEDEIGSLVAKVEEPEEESEISSDYSDGESSD